MGLDPLARPLTGRPNILQVEDNPADIELIRCELRRGGIDADLTSTDNPADVEVLLRSNTYDLILSDYQLPRGSVLDDLTLARRRRRTSACSDTNTLRFVPPTRKPRKGVSASARRRKKA